jgi:quinone-modifying oxidoreductase, subunit QmoA
MSDPTSLPVQPPPRGRVLVVGGGIAGLSAAVEAAETGFHVVLVEREAHLGGRVAQMNQYFPKLCPPSCGLELNLRRLRSGRRLDYLTTAEVCDIEEFSDKLRVHVVQRPRFVTEQCSACGACAKVCPVDQKNPFDLQMGTRKAIYLPHASAFPTRYAIDPSACLGESCARCVTECPLGAIDLAMAPRELAFDVQAVLWATGWNPYDAASLDDLGFGKHPDVITNLMLERLASPSGPTGGRIVCPSDGREPKRVAFVQCAGSRDLSHLEYCSGVCCLASAKQARYLRSAYPDVEISILYIDRRAAGNLERFLATTAEDPKIRFVPGKVAKVTVDGGMPVVEFENVAEGRLSNERVDLVVLATGMVPARSGHPTLHRLARDTSGFLLADQPSARQIPIGCARQPMDVAASVRDAASAVSKALSLRAGSCGSGSRARPVRDTRRGEP